MKRVASLLVVCCLMTGLRPATALAQAILGSGQWTGWGNTQDHVDAHHWRYIGAAEFIQGDMKLNADLIEYYDDVHRLIASGNVTVAQADSAISATSIDFNTETQTGTFYGSPAWGMASLGTRVDRALFGTLEPDMYFYGETIEKIGPKKYRITRGGFTTCVQPVPRWELTSGSVVISLDHYAVLTNSVLRVKGVPLFYLPILYYPVKTKAEDRSTGFLMPTYGTSTLRGFSLSNAFFWAIGRSEDLTVMHDWYSKTGQGVGTEYRYVRGPGSSGNLSAYMLNEHAVSDGSAVTPGKRSYELRGNATENLGHGWRAAGRISYFTDVVTQQTYNTNIYDASRSQRTMSGNLTGSLLGYRVTASVDRNEYFTGTTDSTLAASAPRLTISRGERPIGRLPVYVSLGGEYVTLQRRSTATTAEGDTTTTTVTDQSLSRVDFSPTLRVPFTKLPFLSINSSIGWRGSYWTKSWDANQNLLDQSVSRRYFDLQSNITGPVFNRIFTLDNGYAEKLKHTVEPFMNLRYTTAIPEFDRIVQWEGPDGVVGDNGQVTYGVNNRLYAKLKQDGKVTASREILSVGVRQTYYTNPVASQFDRNYATSFGTSKPYHFSAIALSARALPTDRLNATFTSEYDPRFKLLLAVSSNGNYSVSNWLTTSAGWTLTRSIGEDGKIDPNGLSHFFNGGANVRLHENKYGANYSFNYNVVTSQFVQQRITGFYNAQCCGFAVEYQAFDYGNLPTRIPQDRRFNFSFTLAGIGSFSNFFGVLGGAR
jgi:lipopolysaccharide assembly outer membrane protein LptD (OstA)